MITDISQLDPKGTYTYADYLTWEFEEWVELLNGKYRVFNKPGKSPLHQQVTTSLGRAFAEQIRQPHYVVWHIPLPVIFGYQPDDESLDLFIPDVFIIDDQFPNVPYETGWKGIPLLVVEVVDKRTVTLDTTTKFDLYRQYGVSEYWLVLLDERAVHIFTLQDEKYTLVDVYKSGEIPCRIFPDLIVPHERIFR